MSELKVGSIVESMTSTSALTVKILGNNQVVVQTETGKLDVLPPDELYLVPGDDYCRLRRTIIDTMDKLTKEIGRNNMHSTRYQLALSRALYDADVRRGADVVESLQKKIVASIASGINSPEVQNILRQNAEYAVKGEPLPITIVNPTHIPLMKPEGWEAKAAPFTPVEEASDEPNVLRHTSIEGHSETLVQQLTDDELAKMCIEVAEMLAGFTGFMMLNPQDHHGLSELQKTIITYENSRNVRMKQVWEMAKKIVGHCRMAEVDDAIENVLEAIRQQEEPDEE